MELVGAAGALWPVGGEKENRRPGNWNAYEEARSQLAAFCVVKFEGKLATNILVACELL